MNATDDDDNEDEWGDARSTIRGVLAGTGVLYQAEGIAFAHSCVAPAPSSLPAFFRARTPAAADCRRRHRHPSRRPDRPSGTTRTSTGPQISLLPTMMRLSSRYLPPPPTTADPTTARHRPEGSVRRAQSRIISSGVTMTVAAGWSLAVR